MRVTLRSSRLRRFIQCLSIFCASAGLVTVARAQEIERIARTVEEALATIDPARDFASDPWRDPREPAVQKEFLERLRSRLSGCPPLGLDSASPEDWTAALGFSLDSDPRSLAAQSGYWHRVKTLLAENQLRCDQKNSVEGVPDGPICQQWCLYRGRVCRDRCAQFGPPERECLDTCSLQIEFCSSWCFLI